MVKVPLLRQISPVPSAARDVVSRSSGAPEPFCLARSIIQPRSSALREVARLFLKLGLVAFGGPAAHIGLMRDEVVRRRGWMSDEEFLDAVGAVNLLPGPNSTELALHIGRRQAGVAGLLVAGACFILPPVALVLLCAWAYVRYGRLPAVLGAWAGAQPVVVAVVTMALVGWELGRHALTSPWLGDGATASRARLRPSIAVRPRPRATIPEPVCSRAPPQCRGFEP